jgi:hypothetical protein
MKSRKIINKAPDINPTNGGNHLGLWDISSAGISNDHTEAAIITPDAKPYNIFSVLFLKVLKKKTVDAPIVVPKKGSRAQIIICVFVLFIFIISTFSVFHYKYILLLKIGEFLYFVGKKGLALLTKKYLRDNMYCSKGVGI